MNTEKIEMPITIGIKAKTGERTLHIPEQYWKEMEIGKELIKHCYDNRGTWVLTVKLERR